MVSFGDVGFQADGGDGGIKTELKKITKHKLQKIAILNNESFYLLIGTVERNLVVRDKTLKDVGGQHLGQEGIAATAQCPVPQLTGSLSDQLHFGGACIGGKKSF